MLDSLCTPLLGDAGIIFAYEHSNAAGRFVLFILLIVSTFSWAVMWTKFSYIREARKQTQRFMRLFRQSKTPIALFEKQASFSPSPVAEVYNHGCRELCFHLLGSTTVDETFSARLSVVDPIDATSMASVRSAMERTVGEEMLKLESNLTLLATAVSGSPFLGLLGTVWGVMDAFSGVATAGRADLSAMAPGVSGALITTVIALCVAIPAMFGYNFLVTTIRSMTIEMENFSAECASSFEHNYTHHRS